MLNDHFSYLLVHIPKNRIKSGVRVKTQKFELAVSLSANNVCIIVLSAADEGEERAWCKSGFELPIKAGRPARLPRIWSFRRPPIRLTKEKKTVC